MQTLIEKLYEPKVGENGLYRMFSPDEIRIPARFPGAGIEGRIELPGPKLPTEGIPLEVMLGYQAPQSLYVMYSFGVSPGFDPRPMEPVTIGGWFEPLAGATLGPYEQRDMFDFSKGSYEKFDPFKGSKNTAYVPLGSDDQYTIGVSHHSEGLGKLKVFDKDTGVEYGVPICDIIKPMNEWRIDKMY